MKFLKYAVILILLCLLFNLAYKMGDRDGFEEGQKHGYGLECRNDLELLKKVVEAQQKSLANAEGMLTDYARVRDSLLLVKRVAKHNEAQDRLRELYATRKPKSRVDSIMLAEPTAAMRCTSTMNPDGSIVWDDENCLDCFLRINGKVVGKDCEKYYAKR